MSISRKDRTGGSQDQLSLLPEEAVTEGRFADVSMALRAALVSAIKKSPASRWEIASRLSELMARDIGKDSIDKWTAESAESHRFPAELLPAFCVVTRSAAPLAVLAGAAGLLVLGPEEQRFVEIARLRQEQERIAVRLRRLECGR
jgi:Arc/MetJ-type ribon-helix-helix transcriptional regulator